MTRGNSKPRAIMRLTTLAAVPVLAIVVAAFATRRPSVPTQEPGHQHGVIPVATAGRMVTLTDDARRRIGVTYAVVNEEAVAPDVRLAGQITVDDARVRLVSSRVDGWIERLYPSAPGQAVTAEAPMVVLYSPMLVAAQEELLLAKRLVEDMANADSATRAHASSMLAATRDRLAAWDVSAEDIVRIETAGRAERVVVLRAPSSGFVLEKNVVEGQRVMAGDALYRIADVARVWLEGEVYEKDLAIVHLGQRVLAEVPAIPGASFAGRVAYIAPTLNPETRTARLRIELANPRHRLKPGMIATLRLAGAKQAHVLTVPRSAVLSTGERDIVFVKRSDGMLEPRQVVLGMATDERISVLSGLARGDSVVASATFLVDAESSLGTALGGMGDMPGMDIVAPRQRN